MLALLEKDPRQRPASAHEVAEALEAIALESDPPRSRAPFAVAALAVGGLAVGGAWLSLAASSRPEPSPVAPTPLAGASPSARPEAASPAPVAEPLPAWFVAEPPASRPDLARVPAGLAPGKNRDESSGRATARS